MQVLVFFTVFTFVCGKVISPAYQPCVLVSKLFYFAPSCQLTGSIHISCQCIAPNRRHRQPHGAFAVHLSGRNYLKQSLNLMKPNQISWAGELNLRFPVQWLDRSCHSDWMEVRWSTRGHHSQKISPKMMMVRRRRSFRFLWKLLESSARSVPSRNVHCAQETGRWSHYSWRWYAAVAMCSCLINQ